MIWAVGTYHGQQLCCSRMPWALQIGRWMCFVRGVCAMAVCAARMWSSFHGEHNEAWLMSMLVYIFYDCGLVCLFLPLWHLLVSKISMLFSLFKFEMPILRSCYVNTRGSSPLPLC